MYYENKGSDTIEKKIDEHNFLIKPFRTIHIFIRKYLNTVY